ncbi:MAG: peptidoglycan DD-metalloendopeptidase family protein [Acidiferrobacterales bacterium]|nr:peptidoglycan DD-metalloendopeptidase family protein [Acidiferrobacterales bacterium]
MTKKWAASFLLSSILVVAPLAQGADNNEKLQQLRDKIGNLAADINSMKQNRSEAYTRLVKVERQLNRMHGEVHRLDVKLGATRKALKRNRQAQEKLRQGMGQQRQSVARQIRTAYLLGSQAEIKLLLNQEHVDDVSRSLAYYRYLTNARVTHIESMQSSLTKEQKLESSIALQQQQLDRLKKRKLEESAKIEPIVKQRKLLLAKLDTRLHQSGEQLRELREDERRLERLVNRIEEFKEEDLVPVNPVSGKFGSQKKRLKMPVRGRILARFGTRRNLGGQHWNGIFIAASTGDDVHAVYSGRVVFSGWLHGFGLLMILDHGEGYMTLYGHNQSLYKVVGDWVDTGDTIASVGNTGNPPRTGLYFGVRQLGKPRNPLIWCKIGR